MSVNQSVTQLVMNPASHCVSELILQLIDHYCVNMAACGLVRPLMSWSVSQGASQAVSHSQSQSVGLSASHLIITQSVGLSSICYHPC